MTLGVLGLACARVGLPVDGVVLLRAGENELYRVRPGVVARVSRPGLFAVAVKEVAVSRWLTDQRLPVVESLADPVEVADRAVTFWRELPAHDYGTTEQVAGVLRQLHTLPAPTWLPALDPLTGLRDRLQQATTLAAPDRRWLLDHVDRLTTAYADLPAGLPDGPLHGDAWAGNIVSTAAGPVILDLERFAVGPPEWDLVSTAVDHFSFGAVDARAWRTFCDSYGLDVTASPRFETLRDIRELRKVTFAAQLAATDPAIHAELLHRLACVRGGTGPRPWRWRGVP
ncbi:aminoglycoside phosphotransferase family protein [Longispora sp. NPDC051575]|uniref:phosphotransferase enzyme family protein n=1 Tax=Longispora sp. NPDC051575 TaxID=3154943 RepID=UPI003440404C